MEIFLIILFTILIGVPMFYMVKHIKDIIMKDYIFDIKFVKLSKSKLQFKKDYLNHKLPIVKVFIKDIEFNFLIDTGADTNIINESVYEGTKEEAAVQVGQTVMATASGFVNSKTVNVKFKAQDSEFFEEFAVMDLTAPFAALLKDNGVQISGILGSRFFNKHKWAIDFDNLVLWTK